MHTLTTKQKPVFKALTSYAVANEDSMIVPVFMAFDFQSFVCD
jgi:hypothetical protein